MLWFMKNSYDDVAVKKVPLNIAAKFKATEGM